MIDKISYISHSGYVGNESTLHQITTGVPQGSVSDPLLYSVYKTSQRLTFRQIHFCMTAMPKACSSRLDIMASCNALLIGLGVLILN